MIAISVFSQSLVCFSKQCSYGGNVSKSSKDSFQLKPVSSNYEIESYILGITLKGDFVETSIQGGALPSYFIDAYKQKGNIPIYFTDIRLRDKVSRKLVKTQFKILLVD